MDTTVSDQVISLYVQKNKNKILSFLFSCVSLDTSNPPGSNYEKMVNFLQSFLERHGFSTKVVEVPGTFLEKNGITEGGRRLILVAEWNAGAKKTLLIEGHYDVVPATHHWKTNPFKPVIKKGRLYGRGSVDQKGEFAANIFALLALKANKMKPGCNIQLVFAPDEEIGGKTGFGYLVEKGFVKPDYGFGEGLQDMDITIGNKGMAWFEITVKGKAAHGSKPYKGKNAFEGMLMIASELKKLQQRVEKRKTKFATKDARDKKATFVMGGLVKGGSKINTVPDEVVFSIDRRVLPEEKIADVVKEIKDCVGKAARKYGIKASVSVVSSDDAVLVKDKKMTKEYAKALQSVYKKKAKHILMTGGTDMRYLLKKDIPAIGHTIRGENYHADDEWVDVEDLMKVTHVRAKFFKELK